MKMRLDLQYKLEDILGSRNVYFQPPEYIKLKYPCVVYSLNNQVFDKANDKRYKKYKRYTLILITNDYNDFVIETLKEKILDLDYCTEERGYIKDNLYYYPFTLYF